MTPVTDTGVAAPGSGRVEGVSKENLMQFLGAKESLPPRSTFWPIHLHPLPLYKCASAN